MSIKIGVIVGSTRPNRLGRQVADWFLNQVQDTPGVEFELFDLAEHQLPFLDEPQSPMHGNYQQPHTKRWAKMIDRQDGYIWVTAEYNHGYPASLKNAIDFLHAEWGKKPVAFVGYGSLGAAGAIEQLVNVAAELHMVPQVSTATKLVRAWEMFDDKGQIKPDHVYGAPPQRLVENLVWWAKALQPIRQIPQNA